MDGTHQFNIEGLIPKLCSIAQELGDDEKACCLRAAGLQALSSLVFNLELIFYYFIFHSNSLYDFHKFLNLGVITSFKFELNELPSVAELGTLFKWGAILIFENQPK